MPKALPGLGQGRAHVLGLDGLAGGNPLAGAAGQGARVTGGVDLIGHVLPVSIGGLGAVVDALKLGGAADSPIEAARAIVVQAGVAEVVLHLGVLLQPVGQGFQLGHGFVNFGAGIGRHRQVGRVAVGIHPHHRAHGGVAGVNTPAEIVEKIVKISEEIGKTPVQVNEAAGFVVNRILIPMINEAAFIKMEGVSDIAGIDAAMKLGANHPMGPLELGDFVGLDICLAIMDVLYNETGDSKYRACPLLRKMVRGGNLGVKSGRGFYVYNADRTKTPVDAQ